MNKNKFFTVVITLGISAIILWGIVYVVFGRNKINQGSFIVSDTIVSSIVELEDKSDETNKWKYDISQNNKISMLIQAIGDATVKEAYIEDMSVKSRNDVHIYIEQNDYDISLKYDNIKNKKINIYAEETEQGDYLVEFDIKNEDVVSNYTIPTDIKELRHDGTVLAIANVPVSQIEFKVKYDLVLVQNNNKLNTCRVQIEMPDTKLITEGFFVQRLDSSNYNFKVGY